MRRQLNLLVLAVTGLVVVAFVVPLGLLVRNQADQRARLAAERDAQTVAAVVVRSVAAGGGEPETGEIEASLGVVPSGVAVVLPAGRILGQVTPRQWLVDAAAEAGRAQSSYTDRGWELALPVITRTDPIVVYALVPSARLTEGVTEAWLLLGLLAVGLMAAAMLVADRLARTVVGPSQRLSRAALALGEGDLDIRVDPEGPPELERVAEAFNLLAGRLRDLLAAEREQVADLSHRLRTPLTAVRLEAEAIPDDEVRTAVVAQIDRLQRAVSELISEARRRPAEGEARSDAAAVVRSRARFWEVLAAEQDRPVAVEVPERSMEVPVSGDELAAAVDALLGNVFSHTDPGTRFRVAVEEGEVGVGVVVEDGGPGFPAAVDPRERGASGGGSTGLGLDICARLAERTGGELVLGQSALGGARVEMVLRT